MAIRGTNSWVLFVIVFGILSVFLYSLEHKIPRSECPHAPELWRGDNMIPLAIARTPSERDRGLSGVRALTGNDGMLFVFDSPGIRDFWMKDMLIPLDIVWLDSDYVVLGAVENAKPESYPAKFPSPPDMRYTLEVASGKVGALGLSTGTPLRMSECPL